MSIQRKDRGLMADHPFGGPFGGSPIPGDPLDGNRDAAKICCPRCKSEKFRAWSNQYGQFRKCYECKNEWPGGMAGVIPGEDVPPGVPAPDDDIPAVQYTGAAFRLGGEDY